MKKLLITIILTLTGSVFLFIDQASGQYTDYQSMVQKTQMLSKKFPSLCKLTTLVRTVGGKDIMVLTIGTGKTDEKPGVAVIGGIEGSYLTGREIALGFAESLLDNSGSEEIRSLLGKVSFYVFPDVSPDASEPFFKGLKYELNNNSRPTDDDRDFLIDEDPYEDLNKDGLITMIRITDPAGNWIESPDDNRIMITADIAKGQKGSFRLISEGIDNDKDDNFNEDGPGGVNINRNLTFNYEEFGTNAGIHPVSEPESKALLDFLFDHYNIFTTICFGPQDNLGQPMKSASRQGNETSSSGTAEAGQERSQGRDRSRKITSILKSDEAINKLVSEKYHEITGFKGAPVAKNTPGNFMEWSYYHYGRYSFSTPAWWFPVEKEQNAEISFLKYAAENEIDDVFIPWTEVKHPDFPGKKAEVGGIRPYVMINPPVSEIRGLIEKHYKFITTLAAMHPELEFLDVNIENKGDNIFRLSLKVHNKGIFATCTEAGESNMWTRIMRLSLETGKNQKFLSGQPVQRISRLEGGSSAEFSWLIMGKGDVRVSAGAINTGIINTSLELK
jgi:hypothetical protein